MVFIAKLREDSKIVDATGCDFCRRAAQDPDDGDVRVVVGVERAARGEGIVEC